MLYINIGSYTARGKMGIMLLITFVFILIVVAILCGSFDKIMMTIIAAQVSGILWCMYKYGDSSPPTDSTESFYNPTKLQDDEKFQVSGPDEYVDIEHELKNSHYNINADNYDNASELYNYTLDKPPNSLEEMIGIVLNENKTDFTVDYGIASHGAELARRNKEALNYRSRFNKDNFKRFFEEELDEADNRRWFDRDMLEYSF